MFYDKFKQLADNKGVSVHRATQDIGLSKSTATKWKRSGAIPNGETLSKIADYFGISVDDLFERNYPKNVEVYDNETGKWVPQKRYNKVEQKKEAPTLTAKDERDIEKSLEQTLSALEQGQAGLMFDGEPLDDITRELLASSLRNSMEMAKKLAKEKYGRKKEG